jgi:hypothetical protein
VGAVDAIGEIARCIRDGYSGLSHKIILSDFVGTSSSALKVGSGRLLLKMLE